MMMQRVFVLSVFLVVGCSESNNVGRQDPLEACTPPETPLACEETPYDAEAEIVVRGPSAPVLEEVARALDARAENA